MRPLRIDEPMCACERTSDVPGKRLTCVVAVVVLAAGALVGVHRADSGNRAPRAATEALVGHALAGTASSDGAGAVAGLENAVHAHPDDADALAALGLAYELRWRATGDASYLPRADRALHDALRARPQHPVAVLGLGSLALTQHRFQRALMLGRRAAALLPGSARPYGVMGDALVELGRYRQAFAAFERMGELRPSLASYARIAYARELRGDLEGAVEAMQLAVDAAGGAPEPAAWAHVEVAKLELALGRVEHAERESHVALALVPGFPSAEEQLAKVEASRERLRRALQHARRAAETIPAPQFVSLLGDLYERRGDRRSARRQRATTAVLERLMAANGIAVDLETAVYRADHGIGPAATVALARRARAARPSIYGDDALGWALARAGRCMEALPWLQRSLRLETKDALLWFHRGYAEGCAGNAQAMNIWYARALELNPAFSVRWAPVAQAEIR